MSEISRDFPHTLQRGVWLVSIGVLKYAKNIRSTHSVSFVITDNRPNHPTVWQLIQCHEKPNNIEPATGHFRWAQCFWNTNSNPPGPLSLYDNSALERKLIWWPLHGCSAGGEGRRAANRAWSCNQMWIKASQFIHWIWDMCRRFPQRTGSYYCDAGEV